MDDQRIDNLTKVFATGHSRRHVIRGLGAGIAAAVLTVAGRGPSAAAPGGQGGGPDPCSQACAFEPKGPR